MSTPKPDRKLLLVAAHVVDGDLLRIADSSRRDLGILARHRRTSPAAHLRHQFASLEIVDREGRIRGVGRIQWRVEGDGQEPAPRALVTVGTKRAARSFGVSRIPLAPLAMQD